MLWQTPQAMSTLLIPRAPICSSFVPQRLIAHEPVNSPTMSKVPAVTLGFWVIKIAATTLGETGGDAVTMTLNLGYLIGTAIFGVILIAAVSRRSPPNTFIRSFTGQSSSQPRRSALPSPTSSTAHWASGYLGGSLILFTLVLVSLGAWYRTCGSVSVDTVASPKVELFYWSTILFSQTLGTALGDWLADDGGFGYEGGALVFAGGLALVLAAHLFTQVSRTLLFWAAFILTRPLGATVGDLLDKPHAKGGLEFGRFTASAVLLVFMVACILLLPQRAGQHPGATDEA